MIKLNDEPFTFKHFNDGSARFTGPEVLTNPNTITWLYENDEEIVQLYYLGRHIRQNTTADLILKMPYVNSARQDRVRTYQDVFTLKYFCDIINSIGFNEVDIFDPHSDVTPALLNNVFVQRFLLKNLLYVLLNSYLTLDTVVAYPDAGSEKRYNTIIQRPYVVGVKERDWETGNLRSLQMFGSQHMIAGHPILLVDDIISRGSTLYEAAQRLKELGATDIYVYASHCENTVLLPNLNGQSLLDIPDLIKRVYTTNSIFTAHHPKVQIIHEF